MEPALLQNSILTLRGQRVILDADLARLYGVETKVLKQAVKRNLSRFPFDFMFELSSQEFTNLRSQTVTSSYGGARYAPMAFTEQGVAMLSSVLRSPQAIAVNIAIMRAFVLMRQHLADYQTLREQIAQLEADMNTRFEDVNEALRYLLSPATERTPIGFKPGEP